MSTIVRRCWSCERVLPLDQFRTNRTGNDKTHGKGYICKACNTRQRDRWLANLPPEQREAQRQKHLAYLRQHRDARTRERDRRRHENITTLLWMLDELARRGLSTWRVAKLAGCNPDTLYRWQRSTARRHITTNTLRKVERVYLHVVEGRTR